MNYSFLNKYKVIIKSDIDILDNNSKIIYSTSNKNYNYDINLNNINNLFYYQNKIISSFNDELDNILYVSIDNTNNADEKIMLIRTFIIDYINKNKYSIDDFLLDLINNKINDEKIINEYFKSFNLINKNYLVINIKSDNLSIIYNILKNTFNNDIYIIDNIDSIYIFDFLLENNFINKLIDIIKNNTNHYNIGISYIFNDINDIKIAIGNSNLTLKAGITFNLGRVIYYDDLKIENIILNLDKDIISNIINSNNYKSLNELDNELLYTIEIFFKNNLDINKTSNELFIHRNSLSYRLDKIYKITNLNLKNFKDLTYLYFLLLIFKMNNN